MRNFNKIAFTGALLLTSFLNHASIIYGAGEDICSNTTCTQTRTSYEGVGTIRQGVLKNGGMDAFDLFGYWKRFDNLTLHRDIDVFQETNTYRFVDSFYNPTRDNVSLTMRFLGSFGSGSFTQVESQTDSTVVVHDGGRETPVTGYLWGNNQWSNDNTNFGINRGYVTNYFDVNLDPYETMTVVQFVTTSRAAADYEVQFDNRHELFDASLWSYDTHGSIGAVNGNLDLLKGNPNYTGLSEFQLDTIVNFGEGVQDPVEPEPALPEPVQISEPGTIGMFALGLAGIYFRRRYS